MVQEQPAVWRAPGNVTIEKRSAQATNMALPLAQQKQAPQQRTFQPAPPTSIKRAVRRMPSVEELPLVAQNEIKAKSGHAPQAGLSEHKRKVGFLERLANVGRGRSKSQDAEMPAKREPGFGQREPDFAMPQPVPEIPRPAQAPRNVRIERPRAEHPVPSLPKRVEAHPRLQLQDADEGPAESLADDDLEIPAFLRRRAN
jgi:cell division protein FtsZ